MADMSTKGCVGSLGVDASRNGFRDTGRGEKLESRPTERIGEAARLRNGLLEERFNVRTNGSESTEKHN